MHRTKQGLMISIGCAGIVMALLLAAVLITHLLANREMVRSFIVAKAAQATGGALVYDRLEISFLPLPHLEARGIHLIRPDAFEVYAPQLSVYPGILSLLAGRVSIRRLALVSPDINILVGSNQGKGPAAPKDQGDRYLEDVIRTAGGSIFGVLAAVDPETDLRVEEGTLTLAFPDAPDLRIHAINASVQNNDGNLALSLDCRSDVTGKLNIRASAGIEATQVSGEIRLDGMDVRPLLLHATLPGGITTENTRATLSATFSVDGSATVQSRFALQFPSLTVMRKDLKLNLDGVAMAGTIDYAGKNLSVSIDSLRSVQPALELSAAARITPGGDAGRSMIEVHAAARELDVAVAGAVTRAIAGDRQKIRTAFGVARQGHLTDAAYWARFETGSNGLRLIRMKASGRLNRGLVTIPGIDADLEHLAGHVIYEDKHVDFKNISGHFKGATFKSLEAAIDWERATTLMIATRSVTVDVAPLYNWLTGFEALNEARNFIETATGKARLSGLEISGPLTKPEKWSLKISGSPEDIRLTSPRVPFETRLSGGEMTYLPGKVQSTSVGIDFLDGSFVSSFQSKGLLNPESAAWRIDGSMGQAVIAWLGTLLPIPGHLQLKPPVDLSDVNITWNGNRSLSCRGGMKTAGDVELFADFSVSPQDWHIRRIHFADGDSRATVAARKHPTGLEVSFSGNAEKTTADHLLENNRTLSGRLEGDFSAVIDTRAPLKSSFTGKLAGEGLHLLKLVSDPIDVRRFSIAGSGGRLQIAPSEVSVRNRLLMVDGVLDNSGGHLKFDLNVEADRVDEELIRALEPIGKDQADAPDTRPAASVYVPRGEIHLKSADFTYSGFNWTQVQADIRFDGSTTDVQVHQANLCGISTTGKVGFSPRGVGLHVTPTAAGASLQATAACLGHKPIKADANYDLSGTIDLPPTREGPVRQMSGRMEFSSANGRIEYAGLLMKIFSILNITEVFTGGQSDLAEKGYGYTKAHASAEIAGGKLQLSEILLDGNSLKITGQGSISLDTRETEITLLAAPLKTIDRIVNKIPIINYIAGGSLISVPLRLSGPLDDIKVTPLSPSAVGKGVIGIMERTLKAPFRLVRSVAEFAVEESPRTTSPVPGSPGEGR
jgi:hypothetical protein